MNTAQIITSIASNFEAMEEAQKRATSEIENCAANTTVFSFRDGSFVLFHGGSHYEVDSPFPQRLSH